MKANIGTSDRLTRFFIACLILIYAFSTSSWIALAISLFVFFESFMSWCLLYQLFGKNSCPKR